jgi:hypothetical protein
VVTADVWLIVDAQEHTDLIAALRQARLNMVTCPQCGKTSQPAVPLLYHDAHQQQVIFAAPPDTPEYVWRDQARDLHALLVGSIAPEARRAYLNDVQIAHDIHGVAHLLAKTERQRNNQPLPGIPIEPPAASTLFDTDVTREPAPAPRPTPAVAAPAAQVLEAIEALMQLNTPTDLPDLVARYPVLLTAEAEAALEQLADSATEQREHEVASGLHQVRMMLSRLRNDPRAVEQIAAAPPAPAAPPARPSPAPDPPRELPPELYQRLFALTSSADLRELIDEHPILLEPWVDTALSHAINALLEDGDDSLAYTLETRREAIDALRQELPQAHATGDDAPPAAAPAPEPAALEEAIEALIGAGDDTDAVAAALNTYPVLLTEDAERALWALSAEAQAHGDEVMARYIVEYRALLRTVRSELDTGT